MVTMQKHTAQCIKNNVYLSIPFLLAITIYLHTRKESLDFQNVSYIFVAYLMNMLTVNTIERCFNFVVLFIYSSVNKILYCFSCNFGFYFPIVPLCVSSLNLIVIIFIAQMYIYIFRMNWLRRRAYIKPIYIY